MLRGQSYLFRAKGEYDENGAMPELTIEQESIIFRIVSEGRLRQMTSTAARNQVCDGNLADLWVGKNRSGRPISQIGSVGDTSDLYYTRHAVRSPAAADGRSIVGRRFNCLLKVESLECHFKQLGQGFSL
jgi:hypothetical protein